MPDKTTITIAPNGNHGGRRMFSPSLEMASRIADWANIFFIGSLVIGVVSTIMIVRMANVKEEHWDELRRQSNEKIAEANERAAKAEKETAELQNWSIKLRMERWQLFWAYKAKAVLRGKPTGRADVLWLKNTSDGEMLASRIATALDGLNDEPHTGWKIERVASVDELPKEARPAGVTVIGRRGGKFVFNKHPNAPELETSLDIVGAALLHGLETDIVRLDYGIDPSLPDDFVRIVIGAKQ